MGREWRQEHREETYLIWRRWFLKKKFGLTPELYEAMVERQAGRCEVCGDPPGQRRLCVDHDHETGVVRALLCGSCNRALGLLRDNPKRIHALYEYMKAHAI